MKPTLAALFFACCAVLLCPAASQAAHVNVIELDNRIIGPATQQYIVSAIERSESDGAVCLILLLDTPGGLLESTRAIVKRIMNAKVPVAVYVAPSGSRAGSAGVFIALSAHVAAMAPGTNIGAAHPVLAGEGGGLGKKLIRRITRDPTAETIVNDTVAWVTAVTKARKRNEEWAKKAVTESFAATATDAVLAGVVDIVADDLPDLLAKMQGWTTALAGVQVELQTQGASIVRLPMSARQELLAVITNPNIACLLMLLGVLGLIVEFTHPGIGFPGIAGLICLLLALYAFQTLLVSRAALALIVLGLGVLIFAVHRALRAQAVSVRTGAQGLRGEIGVASTDLNPGGTIFVHGEPWNASSRQPIQQGEKVRVVHVDGLQLLVEKL